jgi:GAF domain-containing protein
VEPPVERYRTLLQVSNALVSNLTETALLSSIAPALQRALPFDRVALFLHDAARGVLRLVLLESSLRSEYFVVGLEFPVEDTHVGEVFTSQRPLLRSDLVRERKFSAEERAYQDGIRSYIIAPLAVRGRSTGALAVASTVSGRYGQADAEFLLEVATQVALAVENMRAYEEISALGARVKEEAAQRGRAEEMLRSVAEGTAAATGADFFRSLVRHLARALDVRYAFVSECRDQDRVRTLAFWKDGAFGENFDYAVAATPCREVLAGEACHYPSGGASRISGGPGPRRPPGRERSSRRASASASTRSPRRPCGGSWSMPGPAMSASSRT